MVSACAQQGEQIGAEAFSKETERWKYWAAAQPCPPQFHHSHSNQWHFMWEGQINTGKLCGDGGSGRCGEGRIGWVKVLWRESLAGTAWQNYTSLLTLHSPDFHIYLWLFFFKPWALLTWESCCVKHYWLEFLISCHYSMTIGEWNVFYFFPPQLCQQCLGCSHGTACQQQAFSAQDLCCLSQKANLPKV